MNMSNINSTRKSSYSHLSATERGEIAAYLKMGKKPVEIARLLGSHRSTICREIKRGSVDQVKDKNGKQTFFNAYFADSLLNQSICLRWLVSENVLRKS
ncbi:transposase [Streptococcus pyogenes]|nr:transposase [Streptococcus pyogenes]